MTYMKRLALFDLDHTLLPIDSDNEWGRFLCRTGRVADVAAFNARIDAFFEQFCQCLSHRIILLIMGFRYF